MVWATYSAANGRWEFEHGSQYSTLTCSDPPGGPPSYPSFCVRSNYAIVCEGGTLALYATEYTRVGIKATARDLELELKVETDPDECPDFPPDADCPAEG